MEKILIFFVFQLIQNYLQIFFTSLLYFQFKVSTERITTIIEIEG
ncbi:hypothetical protein pb186bvf_005992 [Paramecium bursaria]